VRQLLLKMLVHLYRPLRFGCCCPPHGACGGKRRREEPSGEESTAGRRSASLAARVEALDAAVEVADAACGGVLPQKLDGGADGQYEEGEEEVLRKHRFFVLEICPRANWI
jgi:hypothetical protein